MPETTTSGSSDVDALLEALDRADAAVRALYRQLADDPDLAPEYEAGLVELQRKRLELARQVGVAALGQWRAARDAREAPKEPSTPAESAPTPEPGPEPDVAPTPPAPLGDAPAEAAPPPVSAQQLEEFKAAFATPASTPRVVPRADDRSLLLALARHVTIAAKVTTAGAFEHELEQLERAAAEERQKRWREMSREAQVRWLSLLVAWAKALEQDGLWLHEPVTRVATAFRELRSFSISDNPGFVHGFARMASPRRGGTWREDALSHLREVRPDVTREPAAEVPKPARKAKRVVEVAELDAPEEDELAGWAYRERARGLRVVVLGGEVREERRAALERAFGFESLEWVPTDRPRQVASLAERAEQGSVDVILVTKFASHGGTATIQRVSKAPFLTMRLGYGVTTVRQVLEEYFGRAEEKGSRRSGER